MKQLKNQILVLFFVTNMIDIVLNITRNLEGGFKYSNIRIGYEKNLMKLIQVIHQSLRWLQCHF